jgi:hypothetical protein
MRSVRQVFPEKTTAPYFDAYIDVYVIRDAHPNPYSDAYANGYIHIHANTYVHAYGDAVGYGYVHGHLNLHGYLDAHGYIHSYFDANRCTQRLLAVEFAIGIGSGH